MSEEQKDLYPTLTKLAEELSVHPTTFLPSYGSGIVDTQSLKTYERDIKKANEDAIRKSFHRAKREIESRIYDRKGAARESPDQSFKNAMMWKNEIDYQIKDALIYMLFDLENGYSGDYPRPARTFENKDNRNEYE